MIAIILAILVGLNVHFHSSLYRQNEPLIDYYTKEFEKEIGVQIPINLHYIFRTTDKTKSNVIGTCQNRLFADFIRIDPRWYFNESSVLQKRAVVYHELGHCLCDLDHDNSEIEYSCPASIMNEKTFGDFCLARNWSHYIKDLRKKCLTSR